jgi:hypothetical protein
MTKEQMIVSIIVAIIGVIGASIGGGFAFAQFLIKRKDEKEEKSVQKLIDISIEKLKKEMNKQMEFISNERSEEGLHRFETHAQSIEKINSQIMENSKQISDLTNLTKIQLQNQEGFRESLTALNKMVKISSESQKNNNYDRLLIVTSKVLKSGILTFTDKTNLLQLYTSWKELGGNDPKIETMYDECMKLKPTLEE